MITISDTGLDLILPDSNYFRFQDCGTYKSLSGKGGLKEMDVCWLDVSEPRLFVIELKSWLQFLENDEYNKDHGKLHRAFDIIQKLKDTIIILNAIDLKTTKSLGFSDCISFKIPKRKKFVVLVNAGVSHIESLGTIERLIRKETNGIMELMGYGKISILDISQVNIIHTTLVANATPY